LELVYLWVEDYNGIKNKNLNFGSKYRCDFTPIRKNKEIVSGTLNIEYNEDNQYMDSFFGNNIKVSAVAGKNGSGKSSLLDLIWNGQLNQDKKFFAIFENDNGQLHLIAAEATQNLKPMSSSSYKISFSVKHNTTDIDKLTAFLFTNEAICINPISNHLQIASSQVFSSVECEIKSKINKFSQSTFSIVNDIENYIGNTSLTNESIEKASKYFKEFRTGLLSYEKLELDISSNIFEKSLAIIYDDNIPWYDDFEKPEKVYIGIDVQKWEEFSLTHEGFPTIQNVSSIEEKVFIYYTLKWFDYIDNESNLPSEVREQYMSIYRKYFKKARLNLKDISQLYKDMVEEYSYSTPKVLSTIGFKLAKDYFIKLEEVWNIIQKLKQKNIIKDDSMFLDINKENKRALIQKFVESHISLVKEGINIPSLLQYKFFPFLSSGHQSTLETFATLYDKISSIEDNKIILLLDEIEAYLHPRWQRDFIFLLINFLNIKFEDKKFHIILATHSTFILADIPKDNIVFLGEKDNIDQTFGANIHTLLSDGFFMDDGLMGKFAKEKINKIIKNLNNEDYNPIEDEKKKTLLIIKNIGEPFLKKKLQDMFYRKFDDLYLKAARKKELLEEQARINYELEDYD